MLRGVDHEHALFHAVERRAQQRRLFGQLVLALFQRRNIGVDDGQPAIRRAPRAEPGLKRPLL